MKLYKIGDKVYEAKRKSINRTPCNSCSLYKTGVRQYCPSEELLHKCSRLGWNVYFVEYKGNVEDMEVIELINEKIELKPVYKRIKKGFTRRDVLRELILELKEKLGVDIVRTCDSVDQCKAVIDEIIKIACNCELSSAKDLIAIKDKTIKEIEKSFDDVMQINKDLNRGIVRKDTALKVQEDVRQNLYKQLNEKDEEIEKLKSEYDELRAIYQGDLSSYKEEVKNLDEDRSVLGLIAFKFKRFINKVMKNG